MSPSPTPFFPTKDIVCSPCAIAVAIWLLLNPPPACQANRDYRADVGDIEIAQLVPHVLFIHMADMNIAPIAARVPNV
jgi:hypothetical protein